MYQITGNTFLVNNYYLDMEKINNKHYSCFNETGSCQELAYVFDHIYTGRDNYITLKDGESVQDALHNMLSGDNNPTDSSIKKLIDNWYEMNLLDYSDFIEDSIYCANRTIDKDNGFNNDDVFGSPKFKQNVNHPTLSCERVEDKYSIANEKAKLKYPVGLLSADEIAINNVYNSLYENKQFWSMSPAYLSYCNSYKSTVSYVSSAYSITSSCDSNVDNNYAVRPAITLIDNIKYKEGNGSQETPYIIDETKYYSINVEIVDETKDLNINISNLSQVEKEEEVVFKITPIKGYRVNNLRIIDSNDNEIEFSETENHNEYTFTMPSNNVTIIPSYQRVSNSVEVEDNKNTKEIKIEVNDAKAVVYEDKVVFTVEPKDGYEVDTIKIIDKENNKIDYIKTKNENEYEFVMPDTDVIIIPTYRTIESINVPDTLKNPNTGTGISIIIIVMLIISSITYIIFKRKKNYIMK